MDLRKEVCDLARELAREKGMKPHECMGEAWETVREKHGLDKQRKPIKLNEDHGEKNDNKKSHLRIVKRKQTNRKHSVISDNINFMKKPKDSPKDTFGYVSDYFSGQKEDQKIEIPESIKKMFKFW